MWRGVGRDLVPQQAENELRCAAHVGIETGGAEAFDAAAPCIEVGRLVARVERNDYHPESISETRAHVGLGTVMKRARLSCRETFSLMGAFKGFDSDAL